MAKVTFCTELLFGECTGLFYNIRLVKSYSVSYPQTFVATSRLKALQVQAALCIPSFTGDKVYIKTFFVSVSIVEQSKNGH